MSSVIRVLFIVLLAVLLIAPCLFVSVLHCLLQSETKPFREFLLFNRMVPVEYDKTIPSAEKRTISMQLLVSRTGHGGAGNESSFEGHTANGSFLSIRAAVLDHRGIAIERREARLFLLWKF